MTIGVNPASSAGFQHIPKSSAKETTGLGPKRAIGKVATRQRRYRHTQIFVPTGGAQISLVLREPSLNLNPVIRVIDQVAQVVRTYRRFRAAELSRPGTRRTTGGGSRSKRRHRLFHINRAAASPASTHRTSVVCKPSLVIADEPTGSLCARSHPRSHLGLSGAGSAM